MRRSAICTSSDAPQDLALQKARDNIHQRNHLRLWLSPMRYQGKQVWVGQISRDIGSRLTFHSPTFTTHKIDPDVDEARAALAEDMAYSQSLPSSASWGASAPRRATRRAGTSPPIPYYTDGRRACCCSTASRSRWRRSRSSRMTMRSPRGKP